MVVPNTRTPILQGEIRKTVESGAAIYTDALRSYNGLTDHVHQVIDHAFQYVNGAYTPTGWRISSPEARFGWELMRAVGTVSSFRYLDEQVFPLQQPQHGERRESQTRIGLIKGSKIVGKRLTFAELTGKVGSRRGFLTLAVEGGKRAKS